MGELWHSSVPSKAITVCTLPEVRVCVLQAGHTFAISTELSLSYETSSYAIGTKYVG